MDYDKSSPPTLQMRRLDISMVSRIPQEIRKIQANLWDIERRTTAEYIQHEIKTPLNTMLLCVEELGSRRSTKKEVMLLLEQSLHQVIEVAVGDCTNKNETYFSIQKELEICINMVTYAEIAITSTVTKNIWLHGNRYKFRQLATNLLKNATCAAGANTNMVSVHLSIKDQFYEIKIINRINKSTPDHLVNHRRVGKGYGLEICKKIISEEFSGSMEINRRTTDTFLVTLKIPTSLECIV